MYKNSSGRFRRAMNIQLELKTQEDLKVMTVGRLMRSALGWFRTSEEKNLDSRHDLDSTVRPTWSPLRDNRAEGGQRDAYPWSLPSM